MIDCVVTALFKPQKGKTPAFAHCYNPSWVDKLARGVRRNLSKEVPFICMVDDDYEFEEDVQTVRFISTDHGWFNLMEAFHPSHNFGRALWIDLDTVIVGSLDEISALDQADMITPRDAYRPSEVYNGVFIWEPKAGYRLWNLYAANRDKAKANHVICGYPSEMIFMDRHREDHWLWMDNLVPGQVRSFKVHGPNPDVRILYFHGNPKPHDLAASDPVRIAWEK